MSEAVRIVSWLVMALACAATAGCEMTQREPSCTGSQVDGGVVCEDGGAPRPGPRLQAMVAYADDGFEQVYPGRIWDNQRGEECFWKDILEADGEHTRCLPRFEWLKAGWYLDAACTQRVHWQATCVAGWPDYVRDDAVDKPYSTCPVQELDALYPLVDPLPIGTLLYTDTSGACLPHPNAFDSTNAVRPLGAAVSPSAFVEATIAPAP